MTTKLASLVVLFFSLVTVNAEGRANFRQLTGITYTQSGTDIGDLEYTYDRQVARSKAVRFLRSK
jgi:hypothetical protein